MFIDSRQVAEASTVETAVCIIGGGVAGIILALEMNKNNIDSFILESGGLISDSKTRDLYRGESTGLTCNISDGSRSRYLGGSSNCWGGWCSPLDQWDLEYRPWVPYSGWPFDLNELAPYYLRAHEILKLGPFNYDPNFWETSINQPNSGLFPFSMGKVRNTISQISTPVRFGKEYKSELKESKNISVFLYANVVNIDTDNLAKYVTSVQVKTLGDRKFTVKAKLFILATGGIENARLLLVSNKSESNGLGNSNDVVGRYFMDHPRILTGSISFNDKWRRNIFYDCKYHYRNLKLNAHNTYVSAQLALTAQTLENEGLLNSRVWLSSALPGELTEGAKALYRRKQSIKKLDSPDWKLSHDLVTMISHPIDTIGYGLTRIYRPHFLVKDVNFQIIVEPEPDPNSRVSLSRTNKDQLDVPRVEVNWRLGSNVYRTINDTINIIAEEMRLQAVASKILVPELKEKNWLSSEKIESTWHHMGTTRMHNDPKFGVVDSNCKVHSLSNLFIAGSSVFPTAGANYPTITIAALSYRLSKHICRKFT